jgi:hypothetical protein
MSDPRSDALIHGYLQRLDQQLASLPAPRRSALREQIETHISDARSEIPGDDPQAVEELLESLGDPSEIVADEPPAPERKLEGPAVPITAPDSSDALGSAAIVLGVLTGAIALGAAALAAFGTDTGAWLTRSVLGTSTLTSVPFTLRELAATHVVPGYSSYLWIIGAAVIALSLGGLLALIAGRRRKVRYFSGLGIALGAVCISFALYLKPAPPSFRPVPGGEFTVWSNGHAQNQMHLALFFGWVAFLIANTALLLLNVRDRRQEPVVTFPLPEAADPSRSS